MDIDGECDAAGTAETRANGSVSPEQSWRGCTIEAIHRGLNPFELPHLAPVQPSSTHTVLHQCPIRSTCDDVPPRAYKAPPKWDAHHVRMPCAQESKYPIKNDDGTPRIESRWELIEQALLQPISNSAELQEAILSYNSKYKNQWKFSALHKLFGEELDESESRVFFEDLLPRIVRLALRLPELVLAPIPLLKQNKCSALTLTQQQISCLLANALLCTFPRRNTHKSKSEYSTFPCINFNRLYQSTGPAVLEKLKSIFHYFRRVCPTERDASNVPSGCVTYMRRSYKETELPDWTQLNAPLSATPLHINAAGTIEDEGLGLLQVDFANKFLGGGVLGHGCVQEEIRFVICPELLLSMLFTECLLPSEALVMVGCERYSNYTGYGDSFEWAGNHDDVTPRDSSRRRQTSIVAIDALHFPQSAQQYREDLMLRELNKAYVGFVHTLLLPAPGVATGNWGCGAFKGDAHLKALLQLMVCAQLGRPLAYYTFGNVQLRDDVHHMYQLFKAQQTTVKELWSVLRRYPRMRSQTLYQFIEQNLKQAGEQRPESKSQETPDQFVSLSSSTSTEQMETCVLISDDEEAEAVILVSSLEAEGKTSANSSSKATSTTTAACVSPARTSSKGQRQPTLLEMLDTHYDQGTTNATKRHRQGKGGKAEGNGDAAHQ